MFGDIFTLRVFYLFSASLSLPFFRSLCQKQPKNACLQFALLEGGISNVSGLSRNFRIKWSEKGMMAAKRGRFIYDVWVCRNISRLFPISLSTTTVVAVFCVVFFPAARSLTLGKKPHRFTSCFTFFNSIYFFFSPRSLFCWFSINGGGPDDVRGARFVYFVGSVRIKRWFEWEKEKNLCTLVAHNEEARRCDDEGKFGKSFVRESTALIFRQSAASCSSLSNN